MPDEDEYTSEEVTSEKQIPAEETLDDEKLLSNKEKSLDRAPPYLMPDSD